MNLSAIEKVTKGNTRTGGVSDFMELPIEKVYANKEQPRKDFDAQQLEELASSINEDGLIQPVAVVKTEEGYMIVSGERRYRAHQLLGKKTIKAHIINADAAKIDELALIENIQRADLNDYEIAMHIRKLWESGAYSSKTELSHAISKSQSYISKALGCIKLSEEIQRDILNNKKQIGLSVLEELARVKEPQKQKEAYKKYTAGEITRTDIAAYRVEPQNIKEKKKKYVSYGFGTVNEFGNFITFARGDLEGRIAIDTEDIVVTANNSNYKITIEEI